MTTSLLYNILRNPILTEKSNILRDSKRKITFEVLRKSNKKEIKHAAESLFNVRVKSVHTSIYRGKMKRIGKNMGKSSNWKKAILTLYSDSDLNTFSAWNRQLISGNSENS